MMLINYFQLLLLQLVVIGFYRVETCGKDLANGPSSNSCAICRSHDYNYDPRSGSCSILEQAWTAAITPAELSHVTFGNEFAVPYRSLITASAWISDV
ncbi:uncharacterized protein BJ212DRAFT_1318335 [Suillus subaureus]|uniref:Secreted protein n=1 Tax=Suillus subaureus TaxID=48587 RepID=A0A9P7EML5_9AGAM|nr:uncharacterized protein BJ212DRAFT_1414449 [Suillus subaureus]XP_041199407.1 uncharacterized protein BJ212DRAFT_1318335 [Suillus subaureus]KAG1793776.1 hypothetical protein BJ212DRAFT_1414449 [Suillus subaureus]KAG1826154.1 hypothetical protein BJ212DRAFT_1318335 [Suillus subaureus]